jgi:hypothetical protein
MASSRCGDLVLATVVGEALRIGPVLTQVMGTVEVDADVRVAKSSNIKPRCKNGPMRKDQPGPLAKERDRFCSTAPHASGPCAVTTLMPNTRNHDTGPDRS